MEENHTERIRAYKKQLSELGYHSFQIDRIIKDAVGIGSLKNLTREQEFHAAEALADYVRFALKCRSPG